MPSIKDILLKQTAEAFSGRPDMPLMAALAGITPEEASWCPDPSTPSVEQIVRHIAWAKSRFCEKGFGRPMILNDESVNDDGDSADLPQEFPCGAAWGCRVAPGIQGAVGLLEHAHRFPWPLSASPITIRRSSRGASALFPRPSRTQRRTVRRLCTASLRASKNSR